jgi:predicted phage tail protein
MPAPNEPTPPARIVLHGRLRSRFGAEYRFGVSTPGNAIYALCRMVPGFEQELKKGQYRVVRGGPKSGIILAEEEIPFKLNGHDLHIFPAARGRGKGGIGGDIVKAILGVVLIAAAVLTAGGALGVTAAGGSFLGLGNTFLGISALSYGVIGAGLLFAGIGGILTHMPKPPAPNASFLLSGPLNTASQGGPVFLNYGTLVRVGSVMISAGYQAIAMVPGSYETGVTYGDSDLYGSSPINTGDSLGNATQPITGPVAGITVILGGSNYTGPSVALVATGQGSGATAHAVVTGGVITSIVVDDGGSGYDAAPEVQITDGHGTGAEAISTVVGIGS